MWKNTVVHGLKSGPTCYGFCPTVQIHIIYSKNSGCNSHCCFFLLDMFWYPALAPTQKFTPGNNSSTCFIPKHNKNTVYSRIKKKTSRTLLKILTLESTWIYLRLKSPFVKYCQLIFPLSSDPKLLQEYIINFKKMSSTGFIQN